MSKNGYVGLTDIINFVFIAYIILKEHKSCFFLVASLELYLCSA